jgi:Ca2+-binding EF-hand superfamily protein
MFESEYCLEILRETIARNPLFNLEQAFKLCDLNGNGIVSKDELRIVLESHGNRITD